MRQQSALKPMESVREGNLDKIQRARAARDFTGANHT